MPFHLTVTQDFGPYKRGDHIDDPAKVAEIQNSENHVRTVQVWENDNPPAPAQADKSLKFGKVKSDS